MFGRMSTLPIDDIVGMPQADIPDSAVQYTHKIVENLQYAYELARQNLGERALKLRRMLTYDINNFSLMI